MLIHISKKAELSAAQSKFVKVLRAQWTGREDRTLVWRPASIELEIVHNHKYWFATKVVPNDEGEERHWNSFGRYEAKGSLQIALEINIATDRIDKRVSGFAAKDSITGDRFFMHDGGVGGGFKGVGRAAFLEWSKLESLPVKLPDKSERHGIAVASLDDGSGVENLIEFLEKAMEFKAKVRADAPR